MVCSACGYQNQLGHRFCGMCGTPLPHRPLTAPGAPHGTHAFTRFPLVNGSYAREAVERSVQQAAEPAPQAGSEIVDETPTEEPQASKSVSTAADMVPEIPLNEYVKSFRYVPPADPDEMTMHGEAQLLRPETAPVADVAAAAAAEAATGNDGNYISAAADVRERLGLNEPEPSDKHHERPHFLDLSEPVAPAAEPEVSVPAIAGPSFLGLNDAPKPDVPPLRETDAVAASRDRGWTWLAVAALAVFVALGVLEWRSQSNQTKAGPVEVVKTKLTQMFHTSTPAPQAGGSAESSTAMPTMEVEQQSKQPGQNSPTVPQLGAPTVTETQPLSGQKNVASASPGPSATVSQPATTQQAAGPAPTPPNSSKAVTEPKSIEGMRAATAKPKAKAPAAEEVDSDIPVRKSVPGAEEVAKANDASDAAATAAWLWKATAKGNPDAPVRLADMYVKGDGVPHSCEQALVLLQAAAAKGNPQARTRLAQINNSGSCAQRNR